MIKLPNPHPILKIVPYGLIKFFLNHTNGYSVVLNTLGGYAEYRCVYLGDGVYFLTNRSKALSAKVNRLKDRVAVLEGYLKDSEHLDIKVENIKRLS